MGSSQNSRTCLVMFSGGLDSVVASHLLKEQGVGVEAIHFVLPFESGLGRTHGTVRERADHLGIPLTIVEEGEEFLDMLKDPSFGYGKHVNPCIDCRIHRLTKARRVMDEKGASFLVTGEVLGQRPMSQRMDAMRAIEKRAGLEGLLLRPLSAKRMRPTIPEQEGWVDREKLLDLQGRTRKPQLAYARKYGLKHGSPGGGCILTDEQTAKRLHDLQSHDPDYSVDDLKLIAYGRRFRLGPHTVLAVGRKHEENLTLQRLVRDGDRVLTLADFQGPLGVLRGPANQDTMATAGGIVARYAGKAAGQESVRVRVTHAGDRSVITCAPCPELQCLKLRV